MIREITQEDILQCVKVIRESFGTVAAEFGFTEENAARFTAFATTKERLDWQLNSEQMNIGIVEENQVLRRWYEGFGFIHIGTKKYDFFPFTCGYMIKEL